MIRAVLDTNVWVSAILTPGNPPAKILEFALTGKMRLIISPGIIREIGQVLKYPKVKKALKKQKETTAFLPRFHLIWFRKECHVSWEVIIALLNRVVKTIKYFFV